MLLKGAASGMEVVHEHRCGIEVSERVVNEALTDAWTLLGPHGEVSPAIESG